MDQALERVFDENAQTYDRVNSIISLGLDARWRRWAARQAVWKPGARVLDAFAGTGLVGLESAKLGATVMLADASPGMLEVAEQRVHESGFDARVLLTDLTATTLPLAAASFDAITIVFGVRYLAEPETVLRRLAEILAPNGKLVVVEFVVPKPSLVSAAASVYFFDVIPRIAPLIGGRSHLHDALAETTRALGTAENLAAIVGRVGFRVETFARMGFGLVAGMVCEKPPSS